MYSCLNLCLCLGHADSVRTARKGRERDVSVRAGRPPGGPVRSTGPGKNTRSSRVTSALRAFVPFGKNGIVLSGIERTGPPGWRPARSVHAQRVRVGRTASGCVATDRELGDRRRERPKRAANCWQGHWRQAGNALEADGESGRESTAAGRKRGSSRGSEARPAGPEGGPAR